MSFPDISEYYRDSLKESRTAVKAWADSKLYERNVSILNKIIALVGAKSVLEVACGDGWVPTLLPIDIAYTGVDRLPYFIELAQKKNPHPSRSFMCGDLRDVVPTLGNYDLVCSFSTLKHFGLVEWDAVVKLLLSKAPAAALELTTGPVDFDNGTEFHHVFVSAARAARVVESAGHEIFQREITYEGHVRDPAAPGVLRPVSEGTYFTRKRVEKTP